MATKNPRVNVVLETKLYAGLKKLAAKEGCSLSLMARDLLKEALELHEDIHWQETAERRDKTLRKKDAISHRDIWK